MRRVGRDHIARTRRYAPGPHPSTPGGSVRRFRITSLALTTLLAVGLALGFALLAAVSCTQQHESDKHQCEATFGAGDARCAP